MKSSLKNMVLTLFSITLISSATLGFVYGLTKEPIEASKRAKTTGALSGVLPAFDNDPSQDKETIEIDGFPITVYTGRQAGKPVGYAVETATGQGFSGLIKMMVGFGTDGEIINIEVLEHNETPGLGSKMADPGNVLLLSFQGKNPADINMKVKKDGGDVDVITASTISSRAYTDAVERAYKAFQAVVQGTEIEQAEPVDPVAAVLPEYDNDPYRDFQEVPYGTGNAKVYFGRMGTDHSGFAIEVSAQGYNGPISLLVGISNDSDEITGIHVLSQDETPGFGAVISEMDNPLSASIVGKKASDPHIKLKSEGGEIDAISGSTATSEAYVEAVNRASQIYRNLTAK